VKVSSRSNPNLVAGALAGVVREAGSVEIQVVGAGALNQAIKAIAVARGYVADAGMDLSCRPTFADIVIDGEARTAIRLLVEATGIAAPPQVPARPPARSTTPDADRTTPPRPVLRGRPIEGSTGCDGAGAPAGAEDRAAYRPGTAGAAPVFSPH
jgi:stage V sporulation protein S